MINNWGMVAGMLGMMSASGHAQTPAPVADTLTQARALEARLPAPKAAPKLSFDLSPARQERFQKLLPKAWRTLNQREPFHLLVLGDRAALEVWSPAAGWAAASAPAFPNLFARELATQFFYTGGVAEAGAAATGQPQLGPAISLRTLTRAGGSVLDAAPILASTARQSRVDVVLLCYGYSEAAVSMSPVTFTRALDAALNAAREIGAEVILCSPWLPMATAAETSLGMTRPLADALHEMAEAEGVLHADLGDLARLLRVPEAAAQDEGQIFERIETTYRGFFHEAADGHFIPRAALHAQFGSLVYKELLDGPPTLPWTLSAATAKLDSDSQLTVNCTIQNTSKARLEITALPLIAAGWKPRTASPQVSLPAGGSQTITMQYALQSQGSLPLQEPLVRLPLLVTAGEQARVETLRAAVQPMAVVWSLETLFNQETTFSTGCQLVNNSQSGLKGTWEAEFGGKKLTGSYELNPGGTSPLDLRFDLPADSPPVQTLPLNLTVKGDGPALTTTRQVTITRNLGLSQVVPLTALTQDNPPGGIILRATADKNTLTLTCELTTADLLLDATPAWQLEINLDARSYGKRLENGATAALRSTGTAADGPGHVHDIPAWAFGTGYAANYAPKEFKASLTTTATNTRLISLTVPRTYLYLHEWALENGNSQLGLNLRLTLNTAVGYRTWALTPTTKPTDAVESLAVLELSVKPTQRFTVNVQ